MGIRQVATAQGFDPCIRWFESNMPVIKGAWIIMVMQLYRSIENFTTSNFHDCGYYETDASEEVVSEIVASIEKDNKLNIEKFSDAVVTILKARGYSCEPYEIKRFGYSSY